MMRRHVLAFVLAALPSTALAQPQPRGGDREELRAQLVAQARAAQGREDFAGCASYLDAALQIRADLLVRYAGAMCAYRAGNFPAARVGANACLAETAGDAALRGQCALLLRELDAVEAPAPAPTPTTLPVPRATQAVAPSASPAPAPAPRPALVAPAASPRRQVVPAGAIALWAVGGAGVVLGVVGAVLHGGAAADCVVSGDVATCPNAAAAERAQDAGTWATMANVGLGVGLAALAGGTVWWIVDSVQGAPRDATAPRVSASVGPASASLTVRF